MYAWADAEELTKILESMPGNDRTFPLTQRGLGLTESDDYFVEDPRRLSTDQLQSR